VSDPAADVRRARELGAIGAPHPVRVGRYWRCGSCGHICAGRETHHYKFDSDEDSPGTRRCAICSALCPEASVRSPGSLARGARAKISLGRRASHTQRTSGAVAPPSDTFREVSA